MHISDVGCETIAIHNALCWVDGKGKDFNEVIKNCEKIVYPSLFPGIADGMFGCNPNRIGEVLEEFGVKYNKITQYKSAEELVKNSELGDVYIVSYWNNGMPFNGLHTVALNYIKVGEEKVFRALNIGGGSKVYSGLDGFVEKEMDSNEKQFIVLYKLT